MRTPLSHSLHFFPHIHSQANEAYAATFDKGGLALPPAKGAALLICMDARIVPSAALGLAEGDV